MNQVGVFITVSRVWNSIVLLILPLLLSSTLTSDTERAIFTFAGWRGVWIVGPNHMSTGITFRKVTLPGVWGSETLIMLLQCLGWASGLLCHAVPSIPSIPVTSQSVYHVQNPKTQPAWTAAITATSNSFSEHATQHKSYFWRRTCFNLCFN